jgi:hypothetical protein
MTIALGACMNNANNIDMTSIYAQVSSYASSGDIDPVSNMANDKVYVWHGSGDPTVAPGIAQKVVDFYETYIDGSNIEAVTNINSGHNMVRIPTPYCCR